MERTLTKCPCKLLPSASTWKLRIKAFIWLQQIKAFSIKNSGIMCRYSGICFILAKNNLKEFDSNSKLLKKKNSRKRVLVLFCFVEMQNAVVYKNLHWIWILMKFVGGRIWCIDDWIGYTTTLKLAKKFITNWNWLSVILMRSDHKNNMWRIVTNNY